MLNTQEQRQPWAAFVDAPVVRIVPVHPLPVTSSTPIQVTVVDLKMSFWSMVVFMVKWTIASIPALLILVNLVLFLIVLVANVLGLPLP